jgi:hypothetical protein
MFLEFGHTGNVIAIKFASSWPQFWTIKLFLVPANIAGLKAKLQSLEAVAKAVENP